MVNQEIAKQIAEIYQKSKAAIDDKITFGSESEQRIFAVIRDVANSAL